MRCVLIVSIYKDTFSCNIAFATRAFRGGATLPSAETFLCSVECNGQKTSDLSVTTSRVVGFCRRKFASK